MSNPTDDMGIGKEIKYNEPNGAISFMIISILLIILIGLIPLGRYLAFKDIDNKCFTYGKSTFCDTKRFTCTDGMVKVDNKGSINIHKGIK